MRLDKFLCSCGIASRREIKYFLKKGTVCVNGECIKDGSKHLDPDKDTVTVEGKEIIYREFIYLMLNKPNGYVSATFDKHLPTVCQLIPEEYSHFEAFPVGRLDIDTEGLLVLTNDGALSHRVLSPKSHVDKTYFVRCLNPIDESYAASFKEGVVLDDGYKTMPAHLAFGQSPNECMLTIQEGKFHQVKRMMETQGNTVTYLKRISMGGLKLDENLAPGEIRQLTDEEIKLMETKSTEE